MLKSVSAEINMSEVVLSVDDTLNVDQEEGYIFESDTAHFRVEFPGKPEIDVYDSRQVRTTLCMHIDQNGIRYLVDFRKRTKKDSWDDLYLVEKHGLEYSMLAIVSDPVKTKKKGARMTRFVALTNNEEMNFLVVLTKSYVYRVIAVRENSIESTVDSEKFIASFEIVK